MSYHVQSFPDQISLLPLLALSFIANFVVVVKFMIFHCPPRQIVDGKSLFFLFLLFSAANKNTIKQFGEGANRY